jgi:hypothetical protein
MASKRKNKLSQSQEKSLLIAGVVVGVSLLSITTFVTTGIVRSRANEPVGGGESAGSTETPYNEETFREVFLANCTISAKATLSEATAKAYCGCVLDRGVEVHGIKRFIEINQDIAKTYDLSDLKDLIDECGAKAVL